MGVASTGGGGGYYLVGSDGAVYAFGDATYQGGANTLTDPPAPITGIAVDQMTGGYWLVGSDGGVFAYNCPFSGSMSAQSLAAPIVGISAPSTNPV
ncbi:MAG: hypothetical protein WAM97_21275 [Acidimicrobiales bacterium]